MAVIVGVVALAVAVLVVVPTAGGPQPGNLLSRPTTDECEQRALRFGASAVEPEEVSVEWVWSGDDYGWGCRVRYRDGTTSVISGSFP